VSDRSDVWPIGAVTAVFVLVLAAVTVTRAAHVPEWPLLLLGDALVLALLALLRAAPADSRIVLAVSLWYPMLLIPQYYAQLGQIGLGLGHVFDRVVQGWEVDLFGSQLSVTWHEAMPNRALSWVLHSCYAAHYFIFLGVPIWLFLRRGREAAVRAVFAITLTFFVCFLVDAAFPVAGPYYAFSGPHGPQTAVPPARLVYDLLDSGASYGTAFPSSHVAASWCAVLIGLRDARRLALGLAPVALGLALGTVYGQFHYAVDALAGAATALLCFALADPFRAWLASRTIGARR